MHVRMFGARQRQVPRSAAGGQYQLAVFERGAVEQARAVRCAINQLDPGTEPAFDVVLVVNGLWLDEQRLQRRLARQEGLRQRRAAIRDIRLVTKQHDAAPVANGKAAGRERGGQDGETWGG